MSRLSLIKSFILADEALAQLATEERFAAIADNLNARTVKKVGSVSVSWLQTFLGFEGLWIKISKTANDPNIPDDNVIKNGCAIIINYLQSGNNIPIDFSVEETKLMLDAFLQAGIINQTQHTKIITKASYDASFVVETWGGSLTTPDEIILALTS